MSKKTMFLTEARAVITALVTEAEKPTQTTLTHNMFTSETTVIPTAENMTKVTKLSEFSSRLNSMITRDMVVSGSGKHYHQI